LLDDFLFSALDENAVAHDAAKITKDCEGNFDLKDRKYAQPRDQDTLNKKEGTRCTSQRALINNFCICRESGKKLICTAIMILADIIRR